MKVKPEKKENKPAAPPGVKVRIKAEEAENIRITGEFIRLDSLLKFAALVQTGGEAKALIGEGFVKVNGAVCTQRGKKIYPGDRVYFGGTGLLVEAAPFDESARSQVP